MIEIRQVTARDWQQLRGVRLRSLEADPSAFGSTLERELTFTEEIWRQRAESGVTLVAVEPGNASVLGMGLIRPVEDGRTGEINAMWVEPQARGAGVGCQLLAGLLAAGQQAGYQLVRLWVTSGNDAAIQLYTRAGFVPTGRGEPLDSDQQLTVLEYVLAAGLSR